MKTIHRITTLVVVAMLLAAPTFAQNATKPSPKEPRQRVCHTMGNLDRLMQENAKMARRMALIEKQTETYMRQVQAEPAQRSQLVVTIPVVFHILYNTAGENISEAQVMSQLDILNEDFRRLNADQDNVWSQAADTQIEFCLASQDPNGNPTDGILRVPTNVTSFGTNDAMKFTSQGGSDAWPAADYMNFWVCDLGSSLLGYAQFPGGPASTDGIVCNYTATGNTGTASAPFDLGRTATHEVGHYLNLRHIWGDGGCGASDFVDDTPDSDGPNYGCALGSAACGTTDMVQNYMDYSDDACMNLFTQGQSDRMNALFAPGGARASLVSSPGCTPAVPDFALDAQAQTVLAPAAGVCATSVTPVIRVRNNGEQTLTSLDVVYSLDGTEIGTLTWTGALAYAESEDVTLADIAPADGNHTFSFTVSNPNGGTDENAANDTATSDFFMNTTGSGVTISVGGGSWDSEIGWSLDLNGTVLASGGAGSVTECIPNGCFTFNMTDSYGDGWNGATYTLTDDAGNVSPREISTQPRAATALRRVLTSCRLAWRIAAWDAPMPRRATTMQMPRLTTDLATLIVRAALIQRHATTTPQPPKMMVRVRSMTIVECAVETTALVAVAPILPHATMTRQPSLTMARACPTTSVVCVAVTTALAAVAQIPMLATTMPRPFWTTAHASWVEKTSH